MQGFDVHVYVFFYVLTLDVLYAPFWAVLRQGMSYIYVI
mgnify:CR=1 FL=1